jgi:serine/threonine protein kinase
MTSRIGRFEIRGELGRGAQSVVYRGFDPQLQREVAIKTLHFSNPDPEQNRVLLDEARLVSKLRHANIVPIFDAGEEGGDIYLVFELVPGQSLADFLRTAGVLSPVKAVSLLRPVLDAIAQAHANGIIHRDLKPSNILLDENGMPRVMDFGISVRISGESERLDKLSGTPAYMAPEYILKREVGERSDIFAAGLILYEMLAGRRAVQGSSLQEMFRRIVSEDIRLPEQVQVDERLAGILYKALARDPALRYRNVGQFAEALDAFIEPEATLPADASGQATIDFLLRRMRHKSDFPALSESVGAINRIANSETESVSRLSNTILKDFALTNKLLRLVNSAYFRPAGGGNISTVSRAVVVLGFETVRNIAISVLLFEHLQNKGNVGQLKEEFLRANLAGILARDLGAAAQMRDLEQVFICALFHGLGRLLAQYHFPDEAAEIRRVMAQKGVREEVAAQQVLGISLEELGVAIARQWGFPPLIVGAMRRLPAGRARKPGSPEERLRTLAGMANELCEAIALATPENRDQEFRKIVTRFNEAIPLDDAQVMQTLRRAVEEVGELARIVHLGVQNTTFGRQMRHFAKLAQSPGEATGTGQTEDSLGSIALGDDVVPGTVGDAASAVGVDAQAVLTAGIQDISNTLVDGFKLNDILRIILETMYRAMGFKRVILCVRDPRSNTMQGRFGFGPEASELARGFRFPLSFTPDIFHAATSKGVDILIRDIDDPKIAQRVPAWYRSLLPARSFVVFPLNLKGNPVALIYADCDEADGIHIPEKELSLLRTLRNQAVLAIKQGG